jgi:hypothetical protein
MSTLEQFYNSIPNLRNGNANNFNVLHVAAGIPNTYYYLNFATDLPDATDMRTRIAVIAAVYAHKLETAGTDADKAKAYGLILAAVREGMTKAWAVDATNSLPAQTATVAATVWDATQADLAARCVQGGLHARVTAYDGNYVSDRDISSLMKIGMGVFVTCGVIMVRTEGLHHFVGDNKAVSAAIGKQVFGSGFTAPFGLTMEEFEDVAYHKAPHVWVSEAMIEAARDDDTRTRLLSARLASAAVRVPAKYPAESGASAIRNLVVKVEVAASLANVALNTATIVTDCDNVTQNQMNTAGDRAAAVVALSELQETYASDIAICIGLFRAICDHASVRNPGLLRANCLERIELDNPVMVSNGKQQMESALRVQREKARRGIVRGIGLFGADAPDDTQALPADETMAQILAAVVGARPAAAGVP